jgi:hypothetical protein
MNNYIWYLLIGIAVVIINHLIMYLFITTEKQANIFMASKILIVIAVGIWAVLLTSKSNFFPLASSFILAMLIHVPPKGRRKDNLNRE